MPQVEGLRDLWQGLYHQGSGHGWLVSRHHLHPPCALFKVSSHYDIRELFMVLNNSGKKEDISDIKKDIYFKNINSGTNPYSHKGLIPEATNKVTN